MRKLVLILFVFFLFMTYGFSQESDRDLEKSVKKILKTVSPSVVKVVAENHKRYVATGIAIEKDVILTNILIVRRPYSELFIQTAKGKTYPAQVKGKDPSSSFVLLKAPKASLTPIKHGGRVNAGDWVALVGVFYNNFPSIVHGIVSSSSTEELIVNAPMAPGVTGGAVVNKNGELTAVVRGRFGYIMNRNYTFHDNKSELIIDEEKSSERNLCYAIPVQKVLDISSQLAKFGKVKRGYLGIQMSPFFGDNKPRIQYVVKNSPAESAGLKANDVIVEIDNISIRDVGDIGRIVQSKYPGQSMHVKVVRDDAVNSMTVQLGELKKKETFQKVSPFMIRPKQNLFQVKRRLDWIRTQPKERQIEMLKGIRGQLESVLESSRRTYQKIIKEYQQLIQDRETELEQIEDESRLLLDQIKELEKKKR